ncbi:hypothetical protein K504DRAFT_449243 [Pleomassaria siparia CBS 279.74]|uniref:Uncharacterized protein n=1 Tax=Pleomassaria siparia CBS 279.74 TaxID=1314801 RepID=A0A6G1JWK5_9PLEO|nr:hypothetical protein K504DRAFT_449243 [Pleomassaria siparia CBS 279.74]
MTFVFAVRVGKEADEAGEAGEAGEAKRGKKRREVCLIVLLIVLLIVVVWCGVVWCGVGSGRLCRKKRVSPERPLYESTARLDPKLAIDKPANAPKDAIGSTPLSAEMLGN